MGKCRAALPSPSGAVTDEGAAAGAVRGQREPAGAAGAALTGEAAEEGRGGQLLTEDLPGE